MATKLPRLSNSRNTVTDSTKMAPKKKAKNRICFWCGDRICFLVFMAVA